MWLTDRIQSIVARVNKTFVNERSAISQTQTFEVNTIFHSCLNVLPLQEMGIISFTDLRQKKRMNCGNLYWHGMTRTREIFHGGNW